MGLSRSGAVEFAVDIYPGAQTGAAAQCRQRLRQPLRLGPRPRRPLSLLWQSTVLHLETRWRPRSARALHTAQPQTPAPGKTRLSTGEPCRLPHHGLGERGLEREGLVAD